MRRLPLAPTGPPRFADRRLVAARLPDAGPAAALALAALLVGGCGRGKPPAATAAPSASPVSTRPALPWLGQWMAAENGGQIGFDLRADGTAQVFEFKGWARPQPTAGQWAANPDGRTVSLVMRGGELSRMTLLPGPAGLLVQAELGALALTRCPGGRWPWESVDFGRRELLDGVLADLKDIDALIYFTKEGLDVLDDSRKLAGRPTEGLPEGSLLPADHVLQAMRSRLEELIQKDGDARWTPPARARLIGGRDRLGQPYEFYWGSRKEVKVAVAPETRAAFRAVEEPAWRRTHQGEMAGLWGRNGDPWQDFVRPGSREVEAISSSSPAKPPLPAPVSPAAVPFGPGARSIPEDRRGEVVTLVEVGLTERANPPLPLGEFEAYTGREGWGVRNDPARRRYNAAFLDLLQRLAAHDLLTLTERGTTPAGGGTTGAGANAPAVRAYRLTPSERLRQAADPARSGPGQLYVPLTSFVVLAVEAARPWPEDAGRTEDGGALLVSGTYRPQPSALHLSVRPDYPTVDLRFRALLRPGPSGERPCTLAALEWGLPGREDWVSHEMP